MTMQHLRLSKTSLLAAAAAACFALSGCLVSAPPPAYAEADVYDAGIAVHYDRVGQPYYYQGRNVRYVPRNHPRYAEYTQRRSRYYRRY
jgi:hypothetical protein